MTIKVTYKTLSEFTEPIKYNKDGKISVEKQHDGFTLVEVLVVITIIALLLTITLSALNLAKSSAKKVICMSNLSEIGKAIYGYSIDYNGSIPIGPKAPPFLSPADFYPSTGAPTSLISLVNGKPVGLGLLLKNYMSRQPQIVFCPGSDQPVSAKDELARVGTGQAQCSYYYRHASVTRLFDNPLEPPPKNISLTALGRNRNMRPIRALVIDTQFLCPSSLADFNVRTRTHHKLQTVNILFAGGHVISCRNDNGQFTVDIRDYADIRNAFSRILNVLEHGDDQL